MSQPELIGRRVTLVPLQIEHSEALWRAGESPEIWRYMRSQPTSLGDMTAWVRDAVQNRDKLGDEPFAILDQESNALVGSTRLFDVQAQNRGAEIGHTWLSPSAWRTPVNTECKYLLLGYCFERLDYLRVQFKTDVRNLRSQAAIERLGAAREGVLRDNMILANGYVRSSVYFSVLQREWPDVRKRLEGFLAKG